MAQIDRVDGGAATTHLSAAEQDRAYRQQRRAAALAYLTRRDLLDVAEILGLVEPATPPARRRSLRGEVQ